MLRDFRKGTNKDNAKEMFRTTPLENVLLRFLKSDVKNRADGNDFSVLDAVMTSFELGIVSKTIKMAR